MAQLVKQEQVEAAEAAKLRKSIEAEARKVKAERVREAKQYEHLQKLRIIEAKQVARIMYFFVL